MDRDGDLQITTLEGAFELYEWPRGGPNFQANANILSQLGARARHALTQNEGDQLKEVLIDVFQWGGVTNGNSNFVNEKPDADLIQIVRLWSEDIQHGMTLDEGLRILNPFRVAD